VYERPYYFHENFAGAIVRYGSAYERQLEPYLLIPLVDVKLLSLQDCHRRSWPLQSGQDSFDKSFDEARENAVEALLTLVHDSTINNSVGYLSLHDKRLDSLALVQTIEICCQSFGIIFHFY
jgi:hypothetical protein